MQNYKFVKHSGTTCPINPNTMVVYRTTSDTTPVSHIHLPKRAGDLTWDKSDQYMGAILEYAKFSRPNLDESALHIFNAHR